MGSRRSSGPAGAVEKEGLTDAPQQPLRKAPTDQPVHSDMPGESEPQRLLAEKKCSAHLPRKVGREELHDLFAVVGPKRDVGASEEAELPQQGIELAAGRDAQVESAPRDTGELGEGPPWLLEVHEGLVAQDGVEVLVRERQSVDRADMGLHARTLVTHLPNHRLADV